MKRLHIIIVLLSMHSFVYSQNVGINTTGAIPAATNLLEVLSASTSAGSVGIYSAHSGAISGTGYGIWAEKTGASTTNVASYFSASGATNNYAIIVPAAGGRVGIGTSAPESLLEIQAEEGNDATLTLDADDGDDNTDTWFIKSLASDNMLTFTNHVTEYFKMNGPRLYVTNSGGSVFIGNGAGRADDLTANENVFIGEAAGAQSSDGAGNVAIGYSALSSSSSGGGNVAIGISSLEKNTSDFNVAVGSNALHDNEDGYYNNAIGGYALTSNIDGYGNIAMGRDAGYKNISGTENVYLGNGAGMENLNGNYNTFIGAQAGSGSVGDSYSGNVCIGFQSGLSLTTGSDNNVFIGNSAGTLETGSDKLYIDNSGTATPLIWGDFSVNRIGINRVATARTLEIGGTISSSDGVLYFNSDKRLKKNITDLNSNEMLASLLRLKGINFEWNDTITGYEREKGKHFGFTAQNVQSVFPELVSTDGQGFLQTSYSVYDPIIIEAIKALKNENDLLRSELEQNKKEIKLFEQKFFQFEKQLLELKSQANVVVKP